MHIDIAHPLCDTSEFGLLVRLHKRVVTRYHRAGKIKSSGGSPLMIHIREAEKLRGLTEAECLRMLAVIRSPAPAAPQARDVLRPAA